MRLIDGHRPDSALPICCGQIAEIRDYIILIATNGRTAAKWQCDEIMKIHNAAREGHGGFSDKRQSAYRKFIKQVEKIAGA